jgi:hypothetical protein
VSAAERQLTFEPKGHLLTHTHVWSPDGAWIVYDTRSRDDQFTATTIERVHVPTGQVEVLYRAGANAACGVVTTDPQRDRVIFIHGPENPVADWSYGPTRRRGVIVEANRPGLAQAFDAMTYAPPFAPGALRGGSHVHVFSPDGALVSFTYEDEVLHRLGTGERALTHDLNQRNVGVSFFSGPVRVNRRHPRNHDGNWFSVLVTRTVNRPRPGADEISRACEEGWIGREGYLRPDGTRQKRALAFQGTVVTSQGESHAEVYLVDLPEDLTIATEEPLEGTATTRPAPPKGVTQRRLTYTSDRPFPGLATRPRHWLRSAPDGSVIAFLMKDHAGVVQLWTVPTVGGSPRQVTTGQHAIESAFTWSPDGRGIVHGLGRSICFTDVATGQTHRLTDASLDPATAPRPFACVVSPDGRHVAFTRPVVSSAGIHDQIFVVPLETK